MALDPADLRAGSPDWGAAWRRMEPQTGGLEDSVEPTPMWKRPDRVRRLCFSPECCVRSRLRDRRRRSPKTRPRTVAPHLRSFLQGMRAFRPLLARLTPGASPTLCGPG